MLFCQRLLDATIIFLPSPFSSPVKRVLGAKALLQTLNKKPKMSTLVCMYVCYHDDTPLNLRLSDSFHIQEKSRLDWNAYKKNEGIEEELHFHKKDGSVT